MVLVMRQTHVKLGNKVRDMTSGYTGYAVAQADLAQGSTQFNVQPFSEAENEIKDAYSIDFTVLEVVDEGYASKARDLGEDIAIDLGDHVTDTWTGFSGIVTERVRMMNGCTYFTVQPPVTGTGPLSGRWQEPKLLDHKRLKKMDEEEKQTFLGKLAALISKPQGVVKEKDTETAEKKTGAPRRRGRISER